MATVAALCLALPAMAAAGSGAPRHAWLDTKGRPLPFQTAEEVGDFLATAEIVQAKRLTSGITRPYKLTLEKDGVRADAVFHSVDRREQKIRRLHNGRFVLHLVDSYRNQVAAWELARLLGMDSVPPTAMRRFRGRLGSAQLWVQNAMTEQMRRDRGLAPPDWTLMNQQRGERGIFDNLINNIDRNTGNTLIDESWNLWLIDHTRSFGRDRGLPYPERIGSITPKLWDRLRSLDPVEVQERLGPYVGKGEIKSLLHRRDLLVEAVEERIARRGEERVVRDWGAEHSAVTETIGR